MLLLAAGADVNAVGGDDGDTPLHDAASGGNERLVTLLLRAGAASDRPNRRGVRPIDQCDTNERCHQLLSGNVPLATVNNAAAGDDGSQPETDSADEVTSSVDHPTSSEAASPSAVPRAPAPMRVLSPLVAPDRKKQDIFTEVVTKSSFVSGQSISHQSLLDMATKRIHDAYVTKPHSPVISQKIGQKLASSSSKADDSVEEGEIREDTPLRDRAAEESTGNINQHVDSANMTVVEETGSELLKPQSAADSTDVLRHRRGRGRPPSTARKHNTVSNAALMKRQSLQLHRHRAAAALSHDKDRTTPVRPNTTRPDGPAGVASVTDNDDVYDFHDEGESNNPWCTTSTVKLPSSADGDAKAADSVTEQQSELAVQPIECKINQMLNCQLLNNHSPSPSHCHPL